MRILIIGIGSLEHDLVEEFDLKYLKQKEYGKIEVPMNGLLVDPSPVLIWTSFITGKKPGEFGFDNVVVYKQPVKSLINLYYKVRPKVVYENIIEKDKDKKTTDSLSKKLLKYRLAQLPSKDCITCSTLFDDSGCIHENLPVLDKIEEYNQNAKLCLDGTYDKKICECKWKEDFEKQKKQVFDALEKQWTIYMNHFYILDGIQHIYFDDKLKIRTYYIYFDRFIQELKDKLPKDTLLLIVSDSGKKNGLQTSHGFYSVNKSLNLKRPKMTEFKSLIDKIVLESINQIILGG